MTRRRRQGCEARLKGWYRLRRKPRRRDPLAHHRDVVDQSDAAIEERVEGAESREPGRSGVDGEVLERFLHVRFPDSIECERC